MGEAENSILNPLCEKIAGLKLHLNFLQCINSDENSKPIINEIKGTIHNIAKNIIELEAVLNEQKRVYHEMQAAGVHMSHLLYKVNELEQNCNKSINHPEHENVKNNNMPNQVETLSTASSLAIDFSPIDTSLPKAICRFNLQPQYLSFGISYITEDEYKNIPKYMVGRLSLNVINGFIDVVNDTFTRKYSIVSKSKQSLKADELKLYKQYKKLRAPELQGKHFITEEDIARECNRTSLDKRAYNYLTILRHTKKLLRYTVTGTVVYSVNNEID